MSYDFFTPMFYSAILFQARVNPHAIAVSFGKHNVGYGRFVADIERVTRRVNSLVLRETGPVAVSVANPYLHWLVLIALGRLGLVSVSVPDLDKDGVLDLLKTELVLTDQDRQAPNRHFIKVSGEWLKEEETSLPPITDRVFKENDPFRITLSSGTTGIPKKILLTHGQFQHRLRNQSLGYGISSASRVMTRMTLDTMAAFQLPLATWSVGGRAVLQIPGASPYWTIRRSGVNFISMSPVQLDHFLKSMPADASPMPSLTVAITGSALPLSLNRTARIRVTESIIVAYGSTEAGGIARAHVSMLDSNPGATGYIVPWAEVQVVDAAGNAVPHGSIGEVRIRSAAGVTQYLDGPAELNGADAPFRDGWFYPGDVGSLTDTGLLSIVGRSRELMNFGGAKIAPGVIEEALFSCTGVSDIAAFSVDQPNGMDVPWVAVVEADGFQRDQLMGRFAERFPALPKLRVARIDKIPRNDTGKVLRNELRRLVKSATGSPN